MGFCDSNKAGMFAIVKGLRLFLRIYVVLSLWKVIPLISLLGCPTEKGVRDGNTHTIYEIINQSHSQSMRHRFMWFGKIAYVHGRFTPFTIIGDSHKSTSTHCLSCSLLISPSCTMLSPHIIST